MSVGLATASLSLLDPVLMAPPAPLPKLRLPDDPAQWPGHLVGEATAEAAGEWRLPDPDGWGVVRKATYPFAIGPTVAVAGGFEQAVAAANKAAVAFAYKGTPTMHAVLQAKDGAWHVGRVFGQLGSKVLPLTLLDYPKGSLKSLDVQSRVADLRAVVGGSSWVDLRGEGPAAPTPAPGS